MRNIVTEQDLSAIAAANLPWESLRSKTVLVTGASGMLAAYMVESLVHLNEIQPNFGVHVVGLVRDIDKANVRFSHLRGRSDISFLAQDVCAPLQVARKIHFIIHAASNASPKFYGRDPIGTFSANIEGTSNLLKFAREANVEKFLYFSSSEVYGEISADQNPISESKFGSIDPMAIRSCYAESKRMGETMCAAWYHHHAVPAVVVRPFHTYGPGMRLDDGRVFADFVRDALNGNDIVIKSAGLARRAFCYIQDATVGFLTLLLKGENGFAYNVGNPRGEVSVRELADIIVSVCPGKKLNVTSRGAADCDYLPNQVSRSSPDIARILALGWAPITSVADGFRKTLASFA